MSEYGSLLEKIQSKSAVVGIIGLGYVGLPIAREFAESGFRVQGFDIDPRKVESINQGKSYIHAVSQECVQGLVASGQLSATTGFESLPDVDVLLICVPTPLDRYKNPDLQYVQKTARTIAKHCRAGQLVILESTTYPGTTREIMAPILAQSGLKLGQELFVGYSPERENPGDSKWRTRDIPKVVGADTESEQQLLSALYSAVVAKVVILPSTLAAEASKLLENIYRCVNIALVNELKMLFDRMGLDIFEVIEASKSKPFGFQAFYPGPGLGGHCIPIDPFYLSWKAREFDMRTRFIELAGEINAAMPDFVIRKCAELLNQQQQSLCGAKILVLGAAYKENIDDIRQSPALIILDRLRKLGAKVQYHDPFVPQIPYSRTVDVSDLRSCELSAEHLQNADLVLIVTAHTNVNYDLVAKHARLIIDTRNVMRQRCDLTLLDQITNKLHRA